ncbi:MAG: HlyD family efflux transporter periplasmic adaptor subunit [Paramuribaculum sp.]|nr:HlyD family efflux transporter periplasmic adaptor subunit [Paramuribaculum sp.]
MITKKYTKIAGSALLIAAVLSSCSDRKNDYDASGVFEVTEVVVSAQGAGVIKRLELAEGQQIKAESEVGYIDTLQLSLQRRQLIASLSATDSRRLNENRQLASLRQQLANMRSEQRRYQQLVTEDAAPRKQLDDINNQIEVLEKQISATNEQIGSANSSVAGQLSGIAAQVAQIDVRIADCIITSPIDGTVLAKYVEAGEYTAPGKPLFKVGDIGIMRMRAYITASQLTTLKIGDKVKVFADLGDSDRKEYDGIVSWISEEAEFTPKTIQTRDERSNLVYAIKIDVNNDGTIKRGMYGDVKFR